MTSTNEEKNNENQATNKEPYQQAYYPPVPNKFIKWARKSVVCQVCRFVVINYKMLKLMAKSSH